MFMTEIDSTRKKGVHDELARLLVQYVRQPSQDEQHIPKLLEVVTAKKVDSKCVEFIYVPYCSICGSS